jgi:chromosome segregation ATPase
MSNKLDKNKSGGVDMNPNIKTLQEAKERLEREIKGLEKELEDFPEELSLENKEAKEKYDDWIDEMYGTIQIAGITWFASGILEEMDPVAYIAEFNEWINDMDEQDLKMFSEYRDMLERKEELEEELEEIEVAIEEIETEEAMEEDDE